MDDNVPIWKKTKKNRTSEKQKMFSNVQRKSHIEK